jgi:transposase
MARSASEDAKARVLEERGVLNPDPDRVADDRFRRGGFFDPRDLVQVKYEMVRMRSEGATVTEAADRFGYSRPTFYEAERALEERGLVGLLPGRPGPKGARKLTEEVMGFVEELRQGEPDLGSGGLARRVEERFGVSVHPRSIERALARREKKRRTPG